MTAETDLSGRMAKAEPDHILQCGLETKAVGAADPAGLTVACPGTTVQGLAVVDPKDFADRNSAAAAAAAAVEDSFVAEEALASLVVRMDYTNSTLTLAVQMGCHRLLAESGLVQPAAVVVQRGHPVRRMDSWRLRQARCWSVRS